MDLDPGVLEQYQQAAGLVKKLYDSPKTRGKFLEAVKTLNPDAYIPQVDDVNPIVEQIKAVDKRITDFIEGQNKGKRDAELSEARAALRAQGYQEEGIKKIEELMIKENIPSHEAAELLFKKRNPQAPVTPPAFRSDRIFDETDESDKALLADEDAWAEREAVKVLNEMALGR